LVTVEQQPMTGIRPVTPAEVEHYQQHGWVKLDQLYEPWIIDGLLTRAQTKMGTTPLTVSRDTPTELEPNEYNWYARWDGCSHEDDWIRSISHSTALATVAATLMNDTVKFYFDHFFVKLPATDHGSETPWHQDLPHHPLDRQGVLTIWAPLVDCPPEKGSLRFLNGSHRAGLLGRFLNRRDDIQLTHEYPWILDKYDISPPLHMHPGDVTVHNLAITHYAPENTTPDPRWVYSTQWLPHRTRYTGAPNHRTDNHNLTIDQPLDHPRFPTIPTP
jgi:phytanoyl-CoA dioxygenase PhyH